jgi:hypothetical protein
LAARIHAARDLDHEIGTLGLLSIRIARAAGDEMEKLDAAAWAAGRGIVGNRS